MSNDVIFNVPIINPSSGSQIQSLAIPGQLTVQDIRIPGNSTFISNSGLKVYVGSGSGAIDINKTIDSGSGPILYFNISGSRVWKNTLDTNKNFSIKSVLPSNVDPSITCDHNTGNVAIGFPTDTIPSNEYKLDVNGNLRVSGNLVGNVTTNLQQVVDNGNNITTPILVHASGSHFQDLTVEGDFLVDGMMRVSPDSGVWVNSNVNCVGVVATTHWIQFLGEGKMQVTKEDDNTMSIISPTTIHLKSDVGTIVANVDGELRCDNLRIDQEPITETIVPNKTITVSVNGVNYKIPVVEA